MSPGWPLRIRLEGVCSRISKVDSSCSATLLRQCCGFRKSDHHYGKGLGNNCSFSRLDHLPNLLSPKILVCLGRFLEGSLPLQNCDHHKSSSDNSLVFSPSSAGKYRNSWSLYANPAYFVLFLRGLTIILPSSKAELSSSSWLLSEKASKSTVPSSQFRLLSTPYKQISVHFLLFQRRNLFTFKSRSNITR